MCGISGGKYIPADFVYVARNHYGSGSVAGAASDAVYVNRAVSGNGGGKGDEGIRGKAGGACDVDLIRHITYHQ